MLSITRALASKTPSVGQKSSVKSQKLSARWNSSSTNGGKSQKDWVGTVHEDTKEGEEPALAKAMKVNMAHTASKVKGGDDASKRAEEVTKAQSSDATTKNNGSSSKNAQSPWSV